MTRLRYLLAQAASFSFVFLTNCPANSALFAIAAPTFSGFAICHDPNYTIEDPAVNGSISRKRLRDGKLYFSFRVLGGDGAIKYLNENNSLDVVAIIWAGGRKLTEQRIGISQDNWEANAAKLTEESKKTGIFNWRTCVHTQQTTYSSIEIQIMDPNGDFARPLDVEGSYLPSVTINP